jgi:hypothetical protein
MPRDRSKPLIASIRPNRPGRRAGRRARSTSAASAAARVGRCARTERHVPLDQRVAQVLVARGARTSSRRSPAPRRSAAADLMAATGAVAGAALPAFVVALPTGALLRTASAGLGREMRTAREGLAMVGIPAIAADFGGGWSVGRTGRSPAVAVAGHAGPAARACGQGVGPSGTQALTWLERRRPYGSRVVAGFRRLPAVSGGATGAAAPRKRAPVAGRPPYRAASGGRFEEELARFFSRESCKWLQTRT